MSDPMTNVEIEDVLSSIRRLVSGGDKARGDAPASVDGSGDDDRPDASPAAGSWFSDGQNGARAETARAEGRAEDRAEGMAHDGAEQPSPKRDRFVLTPAFLVSDTAAEAQAPMDAKLAATAEAPADPANHAPDDGDHGNQPRAAAPAGDDSADLSDESPEDDGDRWPDMDDGEATGEDHAEEAELWQVDAAADTDPQEAESTAQAATEDSPPDDAPFELTNMILDAPAPDGATPAARTASDRSELVATIAELEAAVSKESHDFEPDGSEMPTQRLGQTIAWPGAIARQFAEAEDAETLDDAAPKADAHGAEDAPQTAHAEASPAAEADSFDDELDEDLDGLLDTGTTALDEEALRALVAQVVHEELTGPLGERITRNVRKLVRREIYRILSSQEFD